MVIPAGSSSESPRADPGRRPPRGRRARYGALPPDQAERESATAAAGARARPRRAVRAPPRAWIGGSCSTSVRVASRAGGLPPRASRAGARVPDVRRRAGSASRPSGCRRARPAARRAQPAAGVPRLRRRPRRAGAAGVLRELDVAYAADAFSVEVDDLRVQHVPAEKETVAPRRGGTGSAVAQPRPPGRASRRRPRVPPAVRDRCVTTGYSSTSDAARSRPPDPLSLRADTVVPRRSEKRRVRVTRSWSAGAPPGPSRARARRRRRSRRAQRARGFRSSSATSGRSSPSAESRCRRSITASASAAGLPR